MQKLFALLCITFFATSAPAAERLTVFAAASLRGALDDVSAAFDAAHVTISYASSAALARQIQLGAPADVFVSANPQWMDVLAGVQPNIRESRRGVASNQMVLIGQLDEVPVTLSKLPDNLSDGHLAMGLLDAVPAGIYGKTALDHYGVWPRVAPNVVQTDNVRAALALVALGEARFGLVYATDALADPRVKVLSEIPTAATGPIQYPAAALNTRPEATDFVRYLGSPEARAIFRRHGFQAGSAP